jgi:hypothetical protein
MDTLDSLGCVLFQPMSITRMVMCGQCGQEFKKIEIRQAGFIGTLTWPRIKNVYAHPVHPIYVILGGHESRRFWL